MPYTLPTIPCLRLRFHLRAAAAAQLPPYKGSMLRGAFGHALRRSVCAMEPDQPCATCRLRQACVYTRIFETFIEGEPPPFLRGQSTAPRPFVFEPGDDRRDFAPGDPLAFDLLLFGQAVDLQAYAVLAVERMARSGLGARRAPFEVDRVEALPPSPPPRDGLDATRATLHLLTPTRIIRQGQPAAALDFRALAFAMLRRVLELAWFHVPNAEIDWTFRPLLQQASAIRITHADLAWHDWDRYSNRQQTRMTLGGLMGTLDLEGDLAPFLPLLRTAEILHVGKNATFGLGRIGLRIHNSAGSLH